MENSYLRVQNCQYGRGLFATKDIDAGVIVEISPVILIPNEEYVYIQKTILNTYTFYIDQEKTKKCICLGLGSLFNHSQDRNIRTIRDEEAMTISFITTKKVNKGEELFFNYGYSEEEFRKRYVESSESQCS